MFPSIWFFNPSGLTIRPQSCVSVIFLTLTSPVDLSTSISATAAVIVLARLTAATPLPKAFVPLVAGAGDGRSVQPAFLAVATRTSEIALSLVREGARHRTAPTCTYDAI